MTNLPKLKNLEAKTVALLGCGDIGFRLGYQLEASKAKVTAYHRNTSGVKSKLNTTCIDFRISSQLKQLAENKYDYAVITLVPDRDKSNSVSAYQSGYINNLKNILGALNMKQLRKLFWVSSTSVYGQKNGVWVDENAPVEPATETGKILLAAEELLKPLAEKACIVRLAGIYRDRKHRLLDRLMQGRLAYNIDNNYFSNRIHVDDCAGLLGHLISLDARAVPLASHYNGVDSMPVDYQTLVSWLSEQVGKPLNSTITAKAPVNSKRISNQRLLNTGYTFIYPDFKQGFCKLIEQYRQQDQC